MNPEVKAKWLPALRSGDYRQTTSILNNGRGEFCCLGVLCEIAVADGVVESQATSEGCVEYFYSSADVERSVLPNRVLEWANLAGNNPLVTFPLSEVPEEFHPELQSNWTVDSAGNANITLAGLNDSGIPFSVIADLIEKYL